MKLMVARAEVVAYFVVPDEANARDIQYAADDAIRDEVVNADLYDCEHRPASNMYEGLWDESSLVYGTKRGEPEITLGEAMKWPRTP